MRQYWRDLLVCLILFSAILALFHPLLDGKVAMNGNGLVAHFSPWRFDRFEGYPVGVPAKPGMPDQLRLYLPYMRFTIDAWRAGNIPLWNPHNFAGNPHMAEMQSAVFYPLNIFMLIFDVIPFWHLMVISGYVLIVLLMYIFLRSKVGIVASLLGSIAWGLSLYVISHSQEVVIEPHSIAWLPLLLLVVDRISSTRQYRWWVVGLFASLLSLLSGYLQTTAYVFGVTGVYALYVNGWFRPPQYWRRAMLLPVGLVFLFSLLAIALVAFQILPGFELFQISSRRIVEFRPTIEQYLMPWYVLITVVIPDFFGHPTTWNEYIYEIGSYYERALSIGIVPFFFATIWWLNRKRADSSGIFFLIVGVIALVLVFNLPVSHLLFWTDAPFFSATIPNRLLFVFAFCLSVLAAFGLDLWVRRQVTWKSMMQTSGGLLLFFGVVLIYLGIAHIFGFGGDGFGDASVWTRVAFRNTAIPLGVTILTIGLCTFGTIRHKTRVVIVLILILLAFAQNVYTFYRFTPFSDARFFYPEHSMITFLQDSAGLYRFWGYGDAFFDNNFATMYSIYSPEGYDSLNSFRYAQLLYAMRDGKLYTAISRSDAGMSRAPDGIWNVHDHPRRKRLWSILGVRYILDKAGEVEGSVFSEPDRFMTPEFRWVFRDGKWQIAEYLDVYPRAYLARDVVIEEDDQKIVDVLFDPTFSPRDTLVLEEKLQKDFDLGEEAGQAEIVRYEPTTVEIKTSSPANNLLFLSDQYNVGWKAYVDGQEEKIYRANFAFRAVPVPAGEHTVIFSYKPASFMLGTKISLSGAGLVGLVSGIWFIKNRKNVKRGI